MLENFPWTFVGIGYLGLVIYVLTSLSNPADESFSSLKDVFVHRSKTLLTAIIVTPMLVFAAKEYGELNTVSAFCAGYANTSLIRKLSETWASKSKLGGN